MRRLLVVPLITLGLVAASAQVAQGDDHRPKLPPQASERATVALAEARDALAGKGGEATLALLELRKSYRDLSPSQRKQADGLFARPTDANDAYDPYPAGATLDRICGTNVCVHYVTDTAEATTHAWAQTTLSTVQAVWNREVGAYGFRSPAYDKDAGGSAQFDYYLANIGDQGLYGYCVPEEEVDTFRASAYCVLDNDYAEFPLPGKPSLSVTAAHEFFHAIQFNYDAYEDPWIMEATATWMEERFADAVNDNRQYLGAGQLGIPGVSLDKFEGLRPYGNWLFFELLSQVYGIGAMRDLWARLDSRIEYNDQYSSQAVRTLLASKGVAFPSFYARFAAGNLIPRKTYSEGAAYRPAPVLAGYKLTNGSRSTGWKAPRLNHLTSKSYRFVPGASLTGTWYVKVNVNGPNKATGAAAYVLVHRKDGTVRHRPVSLDRYGNGSVKVAFSRSSVAQVTLTLANGSTRFSCWRGTPYSCAGSSLDDARTYSFRATAVR